MRQLSSLESYFYRRSKLNLHRSFICGVKLSEFPSDGELKFALKSTIEKFPHLAKNVFTVNDKLVLKTIETIDFEDVIEHDSVCKELNTEVFNSIFQRYKFEFENGKPLWKVLILEQCNYMIFIVDHALADGLSTVAFWKSVVAQLNSGEVHGSSILFECSKEEANDEEPLHPYDEWPISWTWSIKRGIVKALCKWKPDSVIKLDSALLQFQGYQFPDDLLSDSNPNSYEVKNDNIHWILKVEPDIMGRILRSCKSNKVSLTAYLVASILISLADSKLVNTNDGKKFNVSIPVNTRPACSKKFPNLNVDFGNFIGTMDYTIDRESILNRDINDSNGIWSVCSQVQSFIKDQSQNKVDDMIQNAKLLEIMDPEKFIEYKLKNGAPSGTFEVTNLGFQTFNASSSDQYKVVDALFNEPQGISDIFTCAVVSTELGGLTCCISAPKNINTDLQSTWEQLKSFYK